MTNQTKSSVTRLTPTQARTVRSLLFDADGFIRADVEDRVAAAIRRFPNTDAKWWTGPAAVIGVVADVLGVRPE